MGKIKGKTRKEKLNNILYQIRTSCEQHNDGSYALIVDNSKKLNIANRSNLKSLDLSFDMGVDMYEYMEKIVELFGYKIESSSDLNKVTLRKK